MTALQDLQNKADALLAKIEADVRKAGINPENTEYTHADNAAWKELNDQISAIR